MPLSSKRIRIIAAAALAILALIDYPWTVLSGFLLSLIFCLFVDRRVPRRLGKPKFWIFSTVITLLAGLLLGENPEEFYGIQVSWDGMWMGLLMTLRAFTLVVAVITIFQNITRERFIAMTSKVGLKNFDPAFSTAMETLPQVKEAWKEARNTEKTSFLRAVARLLLVFAEIAGQKEEREG
jgi:hypothetical protein